MVAYSKLIGLKGPGAASSRGFRVDIFPLWELEKGDRERATFGAAAFTKLEPVWQADDPRWLTPKPWGFLGPITLKYPNRCIYCGERMKAGERGMYSKKIMSVAHEACRAGED